MPDLWVPWANKREVAMRSSQLPITPVGLVCHTAVSNAVLLVPTGTVRWHFYLSKTGTLTQFFPVNRSAACQRDGNRWTRDGRAFGFLSCESWDGAGTSAWPDWRTNHSGGPAWTAAQMETWGRLGGWLHNEWGISLGKATAAQGKGIGQHSDFTAKSGIRWNTTHACVGTRRKAQMPSVRTRMVTAATPPKPPTPTPAPEDDMPTVDDFWGAKFREYHDEDGNLIRDEVTASDALFKAQRDAAFARRDSAAAKTELSHVTAMVAALTQKLDDVLSRRA